MKKSFRILIALLCIVVPVRARQEQRTPAAVSAPQAQVETLLLEPGKPVERNAAGGDSHTYRINLKSGQALGVTVDQKAIDVSLTLTAPNGQQVVALNIVRPGGVESLAAEATSDAEYRLAVRIAGSAASKGSYVLRAETRVATDEDRKWIKAQGLSLQAKQLIRQGPANAPKVIEASEQALAIWRELNDKQMVVSSLTEIGGAYMMQGVFDKASAYASQALEAAREARTRGGEELALYLVASISGMRGESEEAIRPLEQALELARQTKDRFYEAFFLSAIGYPNYTLGRYQRAAEYYEQALKMALEDNDRRTEALTRARLGMVYMGLSQSEKAVEYLEPAVATFRALKDKASEGMALSNLGAAQAYLSQYDTATKTLQETIALARETKNPNMEASALLTLAGIQASIGSYEAAIEFNEPALKSARESKDRILEARTLLQRSNLFSLLNRYDKAKDYAEQALKINRETKYLNGQGDTLSSLGSIQAKQGHYDEAIKYYEQSLAARRELKDQEGISVSLSNLGQTFVSLGKADRAVEYYEESLRIAHEIKMPPRQAGALAGLGDVYRRLGRFDKAADLLGQALAINRELKRRPYEASTLYYLALAERGRGDLASARSHVEESLKITESIRAELLSPDARASLLSDGQDAYRLSIDLLMRGNGGKSDAGDVALAFQVSERQRARSLLDLLVEARADVRQGVDGSLLSRERELARQLNVKADAQVRVLSRSHTPEQASALRREINQLENDYERAQAEIRRASPAYAALTQPTPLSLSEVQQQLDTDTLLLEYSLDSERSYLWAVTRDSISSFELPKEELIKDAGTRLLNLLTARSRVEKGETPQQKRERVSDADARLPQAAHEVSSMVLGPVASQLANKRLVIVADGVLQYIPFAMLPEPAAVGQRWRVTAGSAAMNNRPLTTNRQPPIIVNHEVVSLPSASSLALQRQEFKDRKPAPRMIAVLADPVFSSTDERVKSSPSSQLESSTRPDLASDDGTRIIEHLSGGGTGNSQSLNIPRLLYTRQEADRILAIAPGSSNLEALGLEANRNAVTSGALKDYRYLHFATHGYLDSERPGLSALVLSMVDAQGKPQDGFLRTNDIYNLKAPAELVVLSACQTGLGKEIKGEGLVGLTRGFMYAGAARVVVSLWNVNDQATADLMAKFYEKMLKKGYRPAAALRAAQTEMWKQKQWQSPYYWAAFTMQGEWR